MVFIIIFYPFPLIINLFIIINLLSQAGARANRWPIKQRGFASFEVCKKLRNAGLKRLPARALGMAKHWVGLGLGQTRPDPITKELKPDPKKALSIYS